MLNESISEQQRKIIGEIDKENVSNGVEALLTTKNGEMGHKFPLHSISYYPTPASSIHDNPNFALYVYMFGPMCKIRPIPSSAAEGTVLIYKCQDGFYLAELDLKNITDSRPSFILNRQMEIDLDDIPVPDIALAPNFQIIRDYNNIFDSVSRVYTLYTIDKEGSSWSIHIDRNGLRPVQIPESISKETSGLKRILTSDIPARFRRRFPLLNR